MSENNLDEISKKLSLLIAVNLRLGSDKLSRLELVGLMSRFGLSNGEIANILGTSKGSVEVIKSRIKKRG